MQRFLLAIVLGIVLPAIWLLVTGAVTSFVFIPGLTDIRIYGEIAPGLLFAPVMIPVYLQILTRRLGVLPSMLNSPAVRLLSFIFFNWTLYGILMYMLLGRLPRFKKQSVSELPPSPPTFVEEK